MKTREEIQEKFLRKLAKKIGLPDFKFTEENWHYPIVLTDQLEREILCLADKYKQKLLHSPSNGKRFNSRWIYDVLALFFDIRDTN